MASVASQAQMFINHTVSSTLPSSSHSFTSNGNAIWLNLSNFTFNSGFADVAWTFDFFAPTNQSYSSVELVIEGTVNDGSLEIIGTENVFDTGTGPAVLNTQGILNTTVSANPGPTSFSATQTFALSPNIHKGNVSKDILFIFTPNGTNSSVNITRVCQVFTPVPEPATMAGLALGLGAIVSRRRKK